MKSIASSRFATVYASVPLLVIAVLLLALRNDPHRTRRRLQQAVAPRQSHGTPTHPFHVIRVGAAAAAMSSSMPTSPAVNVFDPAVFAEGIPHDAFRRLRDEAPVAWQDEHPVGPWPAAPAYWAVTRYVDVRHVLASPGDFSSRAGATQIRDPDAEDLPFI